MKSGFIRHGVRDHNTAIHLIASDSHFFLSGLYDHLSNLPGNHVLHSSISRSECLRSIAQFNPNYLWCAFTCSKEILASDFIPRVKKSNDQTRIVVFRDDFEVDFIQSLFQEGINAYLLTTCLPEEIDHAIEAINAESFYLGQELQESIAQKMIFRSEKKTSGHDILTGREKEVLRLIIDEYTTREIAARLFISKSTVETHRIHLIRKLGVKNTAGLVREAITNRLHA